MFKVSQRVQIIKNVRKSIKIDAPRLENGFYAIKMKNATRGIDLEGSRSHRKPKKVSYKGSKVEQKLANKFKLRTKIASQLTPQAVSG